MNFPTWKRRQAVKASTCRRRCDLIAIPEASCCNPLGFSLVHLIHHRVTITPVARSTTIETSSPLSIMVSVVVPG
jgi:hypothetical protein